MSYIKERLELCDVDIYPFCERNFNCGIIYDLLTECRLAQSRNGYLWLEHVEPIVSARLDFREAVHANVAKAIEWVYDLSNEKTRLKFPVIFARTELALARAIIAGEPAPLLEDRGDGVYA